MSNNNFIGYLPFNRYLKIILFLLLSGLLLSCSTSLSSDQVDYQATIDTGICKSSKTFGHLGQFTKGGYCSSVTH